MMHALFEIILKILHRKNVMISGLGGFCFYCLLVCFFWFYVQRCFLIKIIKMLSIFKKCVVVLNLYSVTLTYLQFMWGHGF